MDKYSIALNAVEDALDMDEAALSEAAREADPALYDELMGAGLDELGYPPHVHWTQIDGLHLRFSGGAAPLAENLASLDDETFLELTSSADWVQTFVMDHIMRVAGIELVLDMTVDELLEQHPTPEYLEARMAEAFSNDELEALVRERGWEDIEDARLLALEDAPDLDDDADYVLYVTPSPNFSVLADALADEPARILMTATAWAQEYTADAVYRFGMYDMRVELIEP